MLQCQMISSPATTQFAALQFIGRTAGDDIFIFMPSEMLAKLIDSYYHGSLSNNCSAAAATRSSL